MWVAALGPWADIQNRDLLIVETASDPNRKIIAAFHGNIYRPIKIKLDPAVFKLGQACRFLSISIHWQWRIGIFVTATVLTWFEVTVA
jgi:hypothetical protein